MTYEYASSATSLIWADVLGQARRNARPVALYLAFAIAAGVMAAFGVIEVNTILIVGAMAISPDMPVLLMAGTLTLLVQRRWGRASASSKMSFRSAS